jgi:PPM family protein phosphatase
MYSEPSTETVEYPQPPSGMMDAAPGSIPSSLSVDIAGLSHTGKVRTNNEDNFLVVRFGRFMQTMLTSLPDSHEPPGHLLEGYGMAVADGMGGMAGGEVASRLALTLLVDLVLETPDWILTQDEPYVDEVIARAVRRFYQVNQSVIAEARRQPRLRGMGTTLTMACSLGADLLIAHVGDSPVYLLRRGQLHRLTRDHTVAAQMVEHGHIKLQDVIRYRSVLTHAIGMRESGSEPDIRRLQLEDGDRILLCTDGLTVMVDDATITATLRSHPTSSTACQALIDLALANGGRDNVTAVIAGYEIAINI